jgi:hypothetical protein
MGPFSCLGLPDVTPNQGDGIMGLLFAGLLAAVFAVFSSISKPAPLARVELASQHVSALPAQGLRAPPEHPFPDITIPSPPVSTEELAFEYPGSLQKQGETALNAPQTVAIEASMPATDACTLPDGQMQHNCASFRGSPNKLNLKRALWLSTIQR